MKLSKTMLLKLMNLNNLKELLIIQTVGGWKNEDVSFVVILTIMGGMKHSIVLNVTSTRNA